MTCLQCWVLFWFPSAYSKHVHSLKQQGQELRTEKASLQDQLATYEGKFQQELDAKMAAIREEMNAKSEDDVQRVKLQSEEHFNRMIDEIKALEAEKMENALQASREKIAIMEANVEQLKGVSAMVLQAVIYQAERHCLLSVCPSVCPAQWHYLIGSWEILQ